jgi:hypothetical protein
LPRNTGSKNDIRVHESPRPTTMTACQSLAGRPRAHRLDLNDGIYTVSTAAEQN